MQQASQCRVVIGHRRHDAAKLPCAPSGASPSRFHRDVAQSQYVEWVGKQAPFPAEGRQGNDDDTPAARAPLGAQSVPSRAEPSSTAPSSEVWPNI